MGEESIRYKKIAFDFLQKFIHITKKVYVWLIWGSLLVLGIVSDCCLKLCNASRLRCNFSYEMGSLIAIIVVIWTFAVTVGMYCLSQGETKYYGVRLVDIFFRTFTFSRASALVIVVAGEMLLLIISTIATLKITIIIIAFLQLYTTCFTFALGCLYFTRTAVILMAQEEIHNVLGGKVGFTYIEQNIKVLVKVAQNTDYENDDEKSSLLNLLTIISDQEKCRINDSEKNKYIRKLSKSLVSGMLDSEADYWEQVYPIIYKWFHASGDIEVNKGIIEALVDNYHADKHMDCYWSCINLIENINETVNEKISYVAIGLWALAYYWCSSGSPGQQWKQNKCRDIANYFREIFDSEKVGLYLTEYCRLLDINRIDLENLVDHCE